MPRTLPHFQELFDGSGQSLGVLISAELWTRVREKVLPRIEAAYRELDPAGAPSRPDRPEPLADWKTLLDYWDFTYPPSLDVHCDHCGAATADWSADAPRKFILRAANLGGLVNFECQSCHARILKKHFKKHVTVECLPPTSPD